MKGHKTIELAHNGERSRAESAWTWVCECGASESCSTRDETLRERRYHLDGIRKIRNPPEPQAPEDRTNE